jgi:kynurenine formamidase
MGKRRLIDLSVALIHSPSAFIQSEITYYTHEQGAVTRSKALNLPEGFFPDNRFAAEEIATISTHAGTHMDAPWHYGPTSEGKASRTIEQIPLEWCLGNGVLLNFNYKQKGDLISANDVKTALSKINYKIEPFDIVLIRTDASRNFGRPGYEGMHPGMSREATLWLIEQGVKVMGIDAWGWDRPMNVMLKEYESGVTGTFWAAHFAGKEKEYCHLENLANLDLIPEPYGFEIAVFPVKIKEASSGWVRAVAIINND